MKKIFIFVISLVLYTYSCAQDKSKSDIQYFCKLEVVNKELFPILDSIIRMKSEVAYFKNGPLFTIWFGLDSIKPDLIIIWAEGEKIFGANHDLGLFDYNGNTFFVRGFLDTTIFSKTNLKRKFIFHSSSIEYLANGEPVFDMGIDKRYCVWTCRYHNGRFKLLSFHSFDNNVKSFDYSRQEYPSNLSESNDSIKNN